MSFPLESSLGRTEALLCCFAPATYLSFAFLLTILHEVSLVV